MAWVAYKQGWHRNLRNMNPMTLMMIFNMVQGLMGGRGGGMGMGRGMGMGGGGMGMGGFGRRRGIF